MKEWLLRWAVFHEPTKQLTVALRRGDEFEVCRIVPDGRGRYIQYENTRRGRVVILECDEENARELARKYPPAANRGASA